MDHIAIGVESPVFPDIGFHAESNFHYEETEGMNKEEEKAPEEPVEQPEQRLVTFTESQFKELIDSLKETPIVPPEPPQETQEPEPEVTEDKEEPATEETVAEPPLVEPERTIPKDIPSSSGWTVDADGRRVLSFKVGQDKKK
jgi:hypothetical protein